jgi:hypothetical protein
MTPEDEEIFRAMAENSGIPIELTDVEVPEFDIPTDSLRLMENLERINYLCSMLYLDADERTAWVYKSPADRCGNRIAIEIEVLIDEDVLRVIEEKGLGAVELLEEELVRLDISAIDSEGELISLIMLDDEGPQVAEFQSSFDNFPVIPADEAGLTLVELSASARSLANGQTGDYDNATVAHIINAAIHHMEVTPVALQEINELPEHYLADVSFQYYEANKISGSEHIEPTDVQKQLIVTDSDKARKYIYQTLKSGMNYLYVYRIDLDGSLEDISDPSVNVSPVQLEDLVDSLSDVFVAMHTTTFEPIPETPQI